MEEVSKIEPRSAGAAEVPEIESSNIPERGATAKPVLRMVFLLGVGALLVFIRYPYPLLSGQMTTFGLLALCVCAAVILMRAPRDMDVVGKDVVVAVLPWLLSGVLFLNGAMDSSREVLHRATVVRTSYGRRGRTVTVRSWRAGNATESVYVSSGFFSRTGFYYPGQTVAIGTRSGALGMPWVTRVTK
jgi:hypothetical protein